MFNKLLRKQRGIGLLELMLSLAIIAILLIMATRYYLITSRSQKVDETVSEIASLQSGASSWKGDNPTYQNISVDDMNKKGLIASSYVDTSTSPPTLKNPWAGDITLSSDSPYTQVDLGFSNVPAEACRSLVGKYGSAITAQDCTNGTFTYSFK